MSPANSLLLKNTLTLASGSPALIFIDARIADRAILHAAARPEARVTVIEQHCDGLAAIAQALETSARGTYSAIHLIGHGEPGRLWLGRTSIDLDALDRACMRLVASAARLQADATIAVYGCDFASGVAGLEAISRLGAIFQRPVFAASRRVGAPSTGGRWSLDMRWDRFGLTSLSPRAALAPIAQAFCLERLDRFAHSFAPPNLLYGVNKEQELFTLDLSDGTTAIEASLPFASVGLARAYDPSDPSDPGLLYFNGGGDSGSVNFGQWNPETNAVETLGSIARDNGTPTDTSDDVEGFFTRLGYSDSTLYVFPTLNTGSTSDTYLYEVTPNAAPNQSTAQRAVNIRYEGGTFPRGGGDIAFSPTNADLMYIARTDSDTETFGLYQVNLGTLTSVTGDVPTATAQRVGTLVEPGGAKISVNGAGTLGFGYDGNLFVSARPATSSDKADTTLYRIDIGDVTGSAGGDSELTATPVGKIGRDATDFASFPEPTPRIDLQVTKDDSAEEVYVGDRITYTIAVTNPATAPAGFVPFDIEGVEVTDTVSPSLLDVTWEAEFTTGSGSFPSDADRQGTGSINSTVDLELGSTVTYTLTGIVGPTAPSELTNTATVELPPGYKPITPQPGAPEDTVLGTDVTRVLPAPVDLSVTQTDYLTEIAPGQTIEYAIVVTNPSALAIAGITVDELWPDALTGVTWTRTDATGTTLGTGNIDSDTIAIAANSTVTYTVSGTVRSDAAAGSLTTTATVALPAQGYTDPNTANNTATDTTTITSSGDSGGGGGGGGGTVPPTIVPTPTPTPTPAPTPTPTPAPTPTPSPSETLPTEIPATIDTATPFNEIETGVTIETLIPRLSDPSLGDRGSAGFSFGASAASFTPIDFCPSAPSLAPLTIDIVLPEFALPETDRDKFGDAAANDIDGEATGDRLYGFGGGDTLQGNDGTDFIFGYGIDDSDLEVPDNDRDWLAGNRGSDVLAGNRGNDTLFGGQDDDWIFGGREDDLAWGDRGGDRIFGERGSDTLVGDNRMMQDADGAGADWIDGGSGADFLFGNAANDTLFGGDADDRLWGGRDRDLLLGGAGDDGLSGDLGDDTLDGGFGNDTLVGLDGSDRLDGDAGDDILQGGIGNDTIAGQSGNDTIDGGTSSLTNPDAGDDFLSGGFGFDLILGSRGNDSLLGGEGDDTLHGGRDDDELWGEAGDDFLIGDRGSDDLCAHDGDDTLIGGTGWVTNTEDGGDRLSGGDGDDLAFGNRGRDLILGEAGDDTLFGGQESDTLLGGAGDDWLSGDRGDDLLLGGDGADTFAIHPATGLSTIADFDVTRDSIAIYGERSAVSFAAVTGGVSIAIGGEQRAVVLGVSDATQVAARLSFEAI